MSDADQDREHAATPARMAQARRDGNVAISHELSIAIQFILGLLAIYLLANALVFQFSNLTTELWSADMNVRYGADEFQNQLRQVAWGVAVLLLPFLIVVLIVCILSHVFQSGPIFQGGRVAPQMSRFSPAHWFKRVFSVASIFRGVLGLPKVLIVVCLAGAAFWMQRDTVLNLSGYEVNEMVPRLTSIVISVAGCVALALFATSLLDFVLQRYSQQQRLRMTDQELRDEQRMQTVDPLVTNRRRQFHQDLTNRVE